MLVTGFLRSGTTLLEKQLHNHPQLCIAPQPLPYLFHHVKRKFLMKQNEGNLRYPLGSLFRETQYSRLEFNTYLKKLLLPATEIADILKSMGEYSGQLAPEVLNFSPISGNFAEIFFEYMTEYSRVKLLKNVVFSGAKEVFCEEFSDYFLEQDIPIILILRDPRDVVASICLGDGARYVNKNLSILHILRSWRKSVAYAIAHRNHPKCHFLRYEDLISNPMTVLDQITVKFGLQQYQYNYKTQPLLGQSGKVWSGNSSFNNVTRAHALLPDKIKNFIELVCGPEMRWLDYKTPRHSTSRTLSAFQDVFCEGKPRLTDQEKEDEFIRLSMIDGNAPLPTSIYQVESWFIHTVCFDILKSCR